MRKPWGDHHAGEHDMGGQEKDIPGGSVDEDTGQLSLTFGIVNLRLTKCEMIQYRVFKKTMTAICCSHVRL